MDLPLAIADGTNTSRLLAKRNRFDRRQSNYYLEAAEILGFISKRGAKYFLTEDGKKYLLMDVAQRKRMLIRNMVIVPIISRVIAELLAHEGEALVKKDLQQLIEGSSRMRGSTVPRRAHTLISWFRWLGEETGVFETKAESVKIRPAKTLGRSGVADD